MSTAPSVEGVIRSLSESLRGRFAALEPWLRVDQRLWSHRPGEGSWSVGEVLEHVALSNRYLLILVEKLRERSLRRLAEGAPLPQAVRDFTLLDALASREFRWPHPAHMAPSGAADRGAIASELEQQRERCLSILRELPSGEGALHSLRMSVVGARLDLYQYLRLVDLHLLRHLGQMERAREHLRATGGSKESLSPPG